MKISLVLLLAAAASTCIAGCRRSTPQGQSLDASTAPTARAVAEVKPTPTLRPEERADTRATRMSLRGYEKRPAPGKRDIWTLKVTDAKTGAPIDDFDVARGRLMLLTIVKSDLSWLGTINPSYNGRGTFTALATLPTPGRYRVFADYTPKGGGHEVTQQDITLPGASRAAPLAPDALGGGWASEKVTAHPEGESGKSGGAVYQVALSSSPAELRAGSDSTLRFKIRNATGVPVDDLQVYSGGVGQCLALSAGASRYLRGRSAPGSVSMGPDVAFVIRFPQPGIYRVWGQFLRRGQVISAPFTLRVGAR